MPGPEGHPWVEPDSQELPLEGLGPAKIDSINDGATEPWAQRAPDEIPLDVLGPAIPPQGETEAEADDILLRPPQIEPGTAWTPEGVSSRQLAHGGQGLAHEVQVGREEGATFGDDHPKNNVPTELMLVADEARAAVDAAHEVAQSNDRPPDTLPPGQ